MPKFRKRPVIINAEQYVEYGKLIKGICNRWGCYQAGHDQPHVHTIHDGQLVNLEIGDWIIPKPDGQHCYPIKPDIFAATYELVEPEGGDPKHGNLQGDERMIEELRHRH